MPEKLQRKSTTDAVEILKRDLIGSNPQRRAEYEQIQADLIVARKIHHLRQSAGLTQAQLAKRVGTSRMVISQMEAADYDGYSLAMFNRIATALG